jgi:hypothetical protein
MSIIVQARATAELPGGRWGETAIVYKGMVEGRAEPVALKVFGSVGEYAKKKCEKEFRNSTRLSKIMPNTLVYYARVQVEQFPDHPAFAMELVNGYPLQDMNLFCHDPGRFRNLLSERSLGQLETNLERAAAADWQAHDLQYFILLADQTIKDQARQRGDLILFDFATWQENQDKPDYAPYVQNLRQFLF